MAVQYGFPERLCEPMQVMGRHRQPPPPPTSSATATTLSTSPVISSLCRRRRRRSSEPEALLDAFASYAASSFYSTLETGSSAEYGEAYLRQTASGEEKSAQAWLYQARRPPRPTAATSTSLTSTSPRRRRPPRAHPRRV